MELESDGSIPDYMTEFKSAPREDESSLSEVDYSISSTMNAWRRDRYGPLALARDSERITVIKVDSYGEQPGDEVEGVYENFGLSPTGKIEDVIDILDEEGCPLDEAIDRVYGTGSKTDRAAHRLETFKENGKLTAEVIDGLKEIKEDWMSDNEKLESEIQQTCRDMSDENPERVHRVLKTNYSWMAHTRLDKMYSV